MIKIGDVFKSEITGKEYQVEKIIEKWVLLKGQGANQVFTNKETLNLFYQRKEMK